MDGIDCAARRVTWGFVGDESSEQVESTERVADEGVAGRRDEERGLEIGPIVAPTAEGFDAVVKSAERLQISPCSLPAVMRIPVIERFTVVDIGVHTGLVQPGNVQHNSPDRTSARSFLLGT